MIIMGLLVVGTALGAIIGLSDSRVGRWVRGTADPDGWRREPKHVHLSRLKRPAPTDTGITMPAPNGALDDGHADAGRVGESQSADQAAGVTAPIDPRQSDDDRSVAEGQAVDQPTVDGRRTTA